MIFAKMTFRSRYHLHAVFYVMLFGCLGARTIFAQDSGENIFTRYGPEKIVTAEKCGECHKSEYAVWKETLHATGFQSMHRKESAEAIKEKMGVKRIKVDSLCLNCHYTPVVKNGKLNAVSGVSCESCHGPARDWINLHNNYGGKEITYKSESPEHKAERISKSKEAGMRRPSEIYAVVANCFQCHTVPQEKLVNVGGHAAGSDFEIIKRSEKIRHNFLDAQFDSTHTENATYSPEHKRVMYVIGRVSDMEYSLRAVGKATEEGLYFKAMKRRIRSARAELNAIIDQVPLPEVKRALEIAETAELALNNEQALTEAADKISEAGKNFVTNHDGSKLAGLDQLIQASVSTE